MATLPASQAELTAIAGRSWSRTFSRRQKDQATNKDLSDFPTGVAQLRAKAGEADTVDPLVDFTVTVDDTEDVVVVSATRTEMDIDPVVGLFDCVLLHTDGETTMVLCPPIKMTVEAGVSIVP